MNVSKCTNNFDLHEWTPRFKEFATRDLYSGRSWKRFADLGFSDKLISIGFYFACDFPGSPEYLEIAQVRKESRRTLPRTKQLISRLESCRNEVWDPRERVTTLAPANHPLRQL